MEVNKSYQIRPISEESPYYEVEEGGLDLSGFQDTIIRRINIVLGIVIAISSLTFIRVINRTPSYKAGFEILSEPITIETKVTSSGSQSQQTRAEITAVNLDEIQLKSLTSYDLIITIVNELKHKYPAINYNSIVNSLSLTNSREETVLEVFYQHSDREQVKDVLQSLKNAYLNYSLQQRQFGLNRGLEFLELQINEKQAEVDEINQELQELRTKYNFIDPRIQDVQITQRLNSLIDKQTEQQTQLEQTKNLVAIANKELKAQSTNSTTAMQLGTSRYNALLEDLRQLDYQISQESTIFTDQNPIIQTLKQQRQGLISLINQEVATIKQKINNQIQLEQKQLQATNQEIVSMQKNLQQWSGITREYEDLELQMNIKVDQFKGLLGQRESLQLEVAQKEAPWKLLTPVGEPTIDSSANANLMILGMLFGLLTGIGAALILDKYQNIVYSPNQVRKITNHDVLSVIPYEDNHFDRPSLVKQAIDAVRPFESFEKESGLQLRSRNSNYNHLLYSSMEDFRLLAVNLGFLNVNKCLNSLIVSSAVSGEGKSTIVVNLAQAIASIGRKVLIVDADFRSTTGLTSSMELSSNQGLSDLLLFNNLSLDDVMQKSSLEENLFILPSGNRDILFDKSKLASTDMQNLMEKLKQDFDLVIYDVPAIVGYADVGLLANQTDGVILVTGLGKVQAFQLKEAVNILSMSQIPIRGIVINNLRL